MIEIREIRKQDYKKAQQFAIKGMHLNWYIKNKILLNLYAKYFWYLELNRATKVYGAYVDDEFVGVLLADMQNETKKYSSKLSSVYVRIIDGLQHIVAQDGVDSYDEANQKMYNSFCKEYIPDGEIIFLAANPNGKIKGIGTALLSVFEKEEQGKLVYLYTDSACTYQFYEHRGFKRSKEQKIILNLGKKKIPLTCMFYTKKIRKQKEVCKDGKTA